jgi:autophagy-related protein 2
VYRARVSFREIEVLDKLKLSNRNKILTEWKTEEMPHEDGSRMFDLVIESVKPEPNILRSEMRVTMDILPLRVNVHQETLTFLLSFFKTVDTPKPEQEPSTSEDTYFQSFQTSDIMIKADYQPTSVSLSKIKEGEYFQLLNLTPINGLEVRLNGLDIHGQSGVSDLVNAITMAIIPQVTGTQIFRFLLGIMPIKSLYNVGSGVMDLVVLPIQQYNHDGQILRGIRRGVTSFVSNIGVESVNLTANTFQLGSYALGSVGSLFSNEDNSDTEAPETPVPSNINDGLQKAYNEIERGLSNAKCAIVAVPRDYERLGTTGAAGSAFKAILYAPTRVVQSTTEALTHVLYGVRGELDPKSKEENPNLYK